MMRMGMPRGPRSIEKSKEEAEKERAERLNQVKMFVGIVTLLRLGENFQPEQVLWYSNFEILMNLVTVV